MADNRENLGTYLMFLFWWAMMLLLGKAANLVDSSFSLWHWVFANGDIPFVGGGNPLAYIGKMAVVISASLIPAIFFVDGVIGIPIRRRRRTR